MANTTRDLHRNTVIFVSLTPEVATIINEIVHALFLELKWRVSCKAFLIELLSRLAERDSFECSHDVFSADLFPSMSEGVRRNKISRWASKLKEDQLLSKYQAVWVVSRNPKQLASGEYVGQPTEYKRGDFWNLFACVQQAAKDCDLMNQPLKNRRQTIRAIVREYLRVVGAIQIQRVVKQEQDAKAKCTSPCKCDCASCVGCKAKAPASNAAPVELVLSEVVEQSKKRAVQIEEDLVSLAQTLANTGQKTSIIDNKLSAITNAARSRFKAASSRANDLDAYAPNAGPRARGRVAMEGAAQELREAQAAAREIGDVKYAEFLGQVIEKFMIARSKVFGSKAISLNGGQAR